MSSHHHPDEPSFADDLIPEINQPEYATIDAVRKLWDERMKMGLPEWVDEKHLELVRKLLPVHPLELQFICGYLTSDMERVWAEGDDPAMAEIEALAKSAMLAIDLVAAPLSVHDDPYEVGMYGLVRAKYQDLKDALWQRSIMPAYQASEPDAGQAPETER